MNPAYQLRVDKRLRAQLQAEFAPQAAQVRAILQRLSLFPDKGAPLPAPDAYRVVANDLKVLYTLDAQQRAVTVYWLARA